MYYSWLAETYRPPSGVYPCADWGLARAGLLDDWRYWYDATPCRMPVECSPWWARYRAASELYVRAQIRYGRWDWARADAAVKAGWQAEMRLMLESYPGQVAAVEPWSRP